MWWLALAGAVAHATPVWERPAKGNVVVGVGLVAHLGPLDERQRFGVEVDGALQRIWHDSPYYTPDFRLEPTPVVQLQWQVGWSPGVWFSELNGQVGALYPMLVGDGGYQPGVGAMGGAGLVLSTDGSVGPIVTGSVLGPLSGARVAVTRWQGAWHAPRLSVGLQLPVTCCSYYL